MRLVLEGSASQEDGIASLLKPSSSAWYEKELAKVNFDPWMLLSYFSDSFTPTPSIFISQSMLLMMMQRYGLHGELSANTKVMQSCGGTEVPKYRST